MKLKINKKHASAVAKLKNLVSKNREVEDEKFNELAKIMKLSEHQNDIFFDYIYNDIDWNIEHE